MSNAGVHICRFLIKGQSPVHRIIYKWFKNVFNFPKNTLFKESQLAIPVLRMEWEVILVPLQGSIYWCQRSLQKKVSEKILSPFLEPNMQDTQTNPLIYSLEEEAQSKLMSSEIVNKTVKEELTKGAYPVLKSSWQSFCVEMEIWL